MPEPRDYYEFYYRKAHSRVLPPLDHLLSSLQLRVYVAARARLAREWIVEEHLLPCNKIYYCFDGRANFTIDGVEFTLEAGDVALLPARHLNSCRTDPKDPVEKLWIHFDARVLGQVDLFDLIPCPPPFSISRLSVSGRVAKGGGTEVEPLLLRVLREFGPDGEKAGFQPLAVNGALQMALAGILRVAQAATFTRPAAAREASRTKGRSDILLRGGDDRVAKIMSYVAQHYSEALTLEDLSARVHLHPTYFSNMFRKAAGIAPMAFLQRFRIERAQALLSSSDLPVNEVAQRVGFTDPYHFSRVFKKVTGSSPSQFQESVRRS
ncbi:MAG TPA: AraC family transcriptional regulator [Planctomycetota bacterium]|nr:AraC family transcriptional regulator [Planctomycetota bacterium]